MSYSPVAGRSALMNVMVRAVSKAARRIVRDFGEIEQLQVSMKGPGNFASKTDHQAEKTLYEELSRDRPDYSFLLEESGYIKGNDENNCFIIDPLDGTNNFIHGVPHFSISVALQRDNEIIAGVIYDPIRDELFCAEKGAGAFMNNRRIRVSGRRDLKTCMIGTGLSIRSPEKRELTQRTINAIGPQIAAIRNTGSIALDLAYVAAGRFDGYWRHNLQAWDVASGLILIKEAGGYVSDMNGKNAILEKKNIVAGNEYTHTPLLKIMKECAQ
ncbi:MAG: inositol monophosphatase family protein [Alphaproteobacteria bacterium]